MEKDWAGWLIEMFSCFWEIWNRLGRASLDRVVEGGSEAVVLWKEGRRSVVHFALRRLGYLGYAYTLCMAFLICYYQGMGSRS